MNLYRMPEIFSGVDAAPALGKVLSTLGVKRIFIVTGPHVSKSEGFAALKAIAEADGRRVDIFSNTSADPSLLLVEEMSAQARAFKADCVLGVGGGSPLDASKIVSILLTHEVKPETLVGTDVCPKREIPLLLIPTTAGTASEVTIYSILTDTEEQIKKAVCSREIIPDYAFLIPEMTVSMPKSVTAATGIDALCHATEAYVSKRRNAYSDVMALKAVRLISKNLRTAYNEPDNLKARENMLMASLFAGLSFNNSSTTAVHAFAYPLGGMHHIPHGMANSLMFAPVFQHNIAGHEERMADLAEAMCGKHDCNALIPAVQQLKADVGMPMNLQDAGIPESDLEAMSVSVMTVTRLLNVNPNGITLDDARRIYREAYEG
ncbi:MAG: iron-containing alcohol dehydrogenase [Opitutales bacterium]|nr:iron-containing alcohol dehydrogenase [Opitutales bacterium]